MIRKDKGAFVPEITSEELVKQICGAQWRNLPDKERDGAWGVAIVKAVFDGIAPDLHELSKHLGVEPELLTQAFRRLSLNGVFRHNSIQNDAGLQRNDPVAWCYYAGCASGIAGNIVV
jgi:hypothetical protein